MPYFQNIPLLPDDPIFQLPLLFAKDARPHKVNLGIGVYQDEDGKPVVLSSIREAETLVFDQHLGKNYSSIDGHPDYIQETLALIFGKENPLIKEKRVFGAHTVGGTGALRLGAEFLHTLASKKIYLSNPSWVNHPNIFKRAGMEIHDYAYFDAFTNTLDFPGLCQSIQGMPPGSVILLQGCGHNPTGVDPSFEQWKVLSDLIKMQEVIPFFDLAYQGFSDGIDEDAQAIRYFACQGHEMLVAYSYSKNMGLYGERVGALAVVSQTAAHSQHVASQIRQMIRGIYSTPPLHGGRLVYTLLKNPQLRQKWLRELTEMRERLHALRNQLATSLRQLSDNANFLGLDQQKGMFSYCGITAAQASLLMEKYAIYLAGGRINVAGLNAHNIKYVSQSISDTMNT